MIDDSTDKISLEWNDKDDQILPDDEAPKSFKDMIAKDDIDGLLCISHNYTQKDYKNRILLGCISFILFFGFSVSISVAVLIGISNANEYCTNYNYNKYNSNNIELLLYNNGCHWKVYNIFSDYPCNCRFLRIDDNLEILNYNSTFCNQIELNNIDTKYLLTNMFSKWNMLERIWFEIDNDDSICVFDNDDLYLYVDDKHSVLNTEYLQVMKIADVKISFNTYIDDINEATLMYNNWKDIVFLETSGIEFINISQTHIWNSIVNNTNNLQYFTFLASFSAGFLNEFPLSICKLSNTLQYFKVSGTLFSSINDCIENFNNLEYFYFSIGVLSYVPPGMPYFISTLMTLHGSLIHSINASF